MLKNLTSYLALLVYANCTWNGLPKHVTSAASTSLQSMSEDLSFLTVLPITEKCLHSESCHFGHYNHLLIALLCTKWFTDKISWKGAATLQYFYLCWQQTNSNMSQKDIMTLLSPVSIYNFRTINDANHKMQTVENYTNQASIPHQSRGLVWHHQSNLCLAKVRTQPTLVLQCTILSPVHLRHAYATFQRHII